MPVSPNNRTLMDSVQCYVDRAQNCCDEHLAHIAAALRTVVNQNSGFTTNKLMLGSEINTHVDLLYPGHQSEWLCGRGGLRVGPWTGAADWGAECVDRDVPLWLPRYQEKFRGHMPEGGGNSSLPWARGGSPASLVRLPCVLPPPETPVQAQEWPSS